MYDRYGKRARTPEQFGAFSFHARMDKPEADASTVMDGRTLVDHAFNTGAEPQTMDGQSPSRGVSAGPLDTIAFFPSAKTYSNQPRTVLYYRRFYLLLLFALNGFIQGAIWNTWGPLTESTDIAFGWDDATIALMSNWGPIGYIIATPLFSWLMDVKGKTEGSPTGFKGELK